VTTWKNTVLYTKQGIQISAGQVSNLLIKGQEQFHAEKEEVCEARLGSTPCAHTPASLARTAWPDSPFSQRKNGNPSSEKQNKKARNQR
jgi:hypothetical protein